MTCPTLRKDEEQMFVVVQSHPTRGDHECEVLPDLATAIKCAEGWLETYPTTSIMEYRRRRKGGKNWTRAELYHRVEGRWEKYHGIGMC